MPLIISVAELMTYNNLSQGNGEIATYFLS